MPVQRPSNKVAGGFTTCRTPPPGAPGRPSVAVPRPTFSPRAKRTGLQPPGATCHCSTSRGICPQSIPMVDDPATKLPTAAQPPVIPRPTPVAAMPWARTLSAGLQPKAGPRGEGQGSIPHPPRRRRPAPLLLAAALAALPRPATAQSPLAAPTTVQLAPAPTTASAASAPAPCDQARLEGVAPPSPRAYAFAPRSQVRPFYQWLNNNGYCGEVSLLAAGMANGQWISQFNARSIASPFPLYPQTGKPSGINFYSQMLLDDLAKPGTTTANSFGQAASWMRLDAVAYPSATQATGAAGARHFLAWIKARIVAGDQVTLGVIDALDRSLPYSHIVSVVRIESNYPAGDTAYHADDVLYVEDHGLITLPGANPVHF